MIERSATLIMPLPPNMMNGPDSRLHWAVKNRKKKAYYLHSRVYLNDRKTRKLWSEGGWVRASATLFVHQLMDDDNLRARLKWMWDALVQEGVLQGDSPKDLQVDAVEQRIDRKFPRVEVVLQTKTAPV